ncbi:G-protein coupled receptor dmsr-1-like [Mytilus californianus]|uniref:G-protein coupled receptor dmsr-1-like n=1 Tax=Mytilus californianus TaxID=6549 RepID=UPI002246E3F0|nr:G-protein coupled receptor dmsr-1-like [Mytilus californianus]
MEFLNNTTFSYEIWTGSQLNNHDALTTFSLAYGKIHGYVSLLVCFFGIPTNIINITVLTRKHMQTSINLILTWMAVSDMLTMVTYVPFAVHFYIQYGSNELSAEKNTKIWMEYLLFHINFSALTHTISIWLGVSLAIFRYMHLQSSETGNLVHVRRIIRARIAIFVIIACSVLLMIPNFMSTSLELKPNTSEAVYIIVDTNIGTPNITLINFVNMCIYSAFAKFVPCLLMIVFGGLLLRTLDMQVRVRRKRMTKLGVIMTRPLHTSRTTVLLLIVMILFLITELPQGILIVLSLFKNRFFLDVYIPLGDVMDILALVNNAINFVLYCSMNREFRRTLVRILRTRGLKHYRTHAHTNGTGTELVTEAAQKLSVMVDNQVCDETISKDPLETANVMTMVSATELSTLIDPKYTEENIQDNNEKIFDENEEVK